jgi:hypothetical protein
VTPAQQPPARRECQGCRWFACSVPLSPRTDPASPGPRVMRAISSIHLFRAKRAANYALFHPARELGVLVTLKPGAKPGCSKTRSPVVRPGCVPGATVQSVALARPASGRGEGPCWGRDRHLKMVCANRCGVDVA